MKFDLHLHTSRHSPDSRMDPLAMIRRAQQIGLDGIVITEHDCLWTDRELEELRSVADGLVILAGVEVTAREGHFLCYGLADLVQAPRGVPVADLCREVHRHGGAVVAAHPFRWDQPFDDILRKEKPELDGLELMTSNMDPDCRRRAREVWRRSRESRPLAGLGSSDAHDEDTLGVCYTDFAADIRTIPDLVHALRSAQISAHDRTTEQ